MIWGRIGRSIARTEYLRSTCGLQNRYSDKMPQLVRGTDPYRQLRLDCHSKDGEAVELVIRSAVGRVNWGLEDSVPGRRFSPGTFLGVDQVRGVMD